MVKYYYDRDADLSILKDKIISIIGYGNQGQAQGLNMRDSGLKVIIGSIKDESWKKAVEDGFEVYSIDEAVKLGDIILLLVPDEVQASIYENHVKSKLKKGKTLVFAHGFNVNYGFIDPPSHIDVVMMAPRMIGVGVRKLFVRGSGAPAFIAVHQNPSGKALETVLALAKAIGAARSGVIETSFTEETEIDHFMEQVVWAAIMRIILLSFEVLVESGYPPETVALELYGSREAAEIFEDMASTGFFRQMDFHSRTSQYGTLSRGPRMIPDDIKVMMRDLLREIREGIFAREWELEQKLNFPVFNKLRAKSFRHQINEAESVIKNNIKISKIME